VELTLLPLFVSRCRIFGRLHHCQSKKLLDDAGYKDVDGDGIREDKEGKPLEIKFASMFEDWWN
jgi:hypothetical protein